jgi:hypothetical protein
LRIVAWAQAIKEDTSRTHDCDDCSYDHGYQVTASIFSLSVDLHVLPDSLLDVREADVGSQSADTIKLNFISCVLTGTRAERHQNDLDAFISRRPVSCLPISLDQYRTVATCSVGGKDLGDWLVSKGLAFDWPQYSKWF